MRLPFKSWYSCLTFMSGDPREANKQQNALKQEFEAITEGLQWTAENLTPAVNKIFICMCNRGRTDRCPHVLDSSFGGIGISFQPLHSKRGCLLRQCSHGHVAYQILKLPLAFETILAGLRIPLFIHGVKNGQNWQK